MTATATMGVDRMRAAGIAVTQTSYPTGAAGIRMSLEVMCQLIRTGRYDIEVKRWAMRKLAEAGIDGRSPVSIRRKATVLLDAYRAETSYAPDAYGAEVIQSPAATLCLRPGVCVGGGDCDDGTVAYISACLSIGIQAVIVKQRFGGDNQEHVLSAVRDDSGNWLYADPSTRLPLGSAHQAEQEMWLDPMDACGNLPALGAELVTISGAPTGLGAVAAHWPQAPATQHVGIGTDIWGNPTLSDLRDLLNAAAYTMQRLQAAASSCGGWPQDQLGWETWKRDLGALQQRLNDAVKAGNVVITKCPKWLLNIRPAGGVSGGFAWEDTRAIIHDEADLDMRFRQAGSCIPPDYPSMPQPQTPDSNLEAYQTADQLWKKTKEIGASVVAPTTLALGGIAVGVVGTVLIGVAWRHATR